MASLNDVVQGGQPTHGNYKGYYNKRPFVIDARLALLPPELFSNKVVLDIGCNEGWVTCEIAQQWRAKKVVGVDIDSELIRAAWRRRRSVWCLQEPSKTKRKRSESPPQLPIPNYFPQAMEHIFGPLLIPEASDKFPHNVTFYTADWLSQTLPDDAQGYDVVVAFSISKWIHLNGGDEGIAKLFQRAFDVLKPGGKFILEPQAWSTYGKAKRMDIKLKETANSLKLRPSDFPKMLEEIGFHYENIGIAGEGGFSRPVDIYSKG
ncbi:Bicoid-interacting protein 3-domain-containing protein [Hysterangium stoloniferum]|nr:Bicoid-interacting protein 3-domain-containing protein [Hysterangium stoloniferum]